MNFDFNRAVMIEKKAPVVATTGAILIKAGKEIKDIRSKLKAEGFKDREINDPGIDIFGGDDVMSGCFASFMLFSAVSFAAVGATPALLGTALACVQGLSLAVDNEFGNMSVEKSALYPEGRRYFMISDRATLDKVDLISPIKTKRVSYTDRNKLNAAYKVVSMVSKLEKKGVAYIPVSKGHQDIYDAVKAKSDQLSSKYSFIRGGCLTMH